MQKKRCQISIFMILGILLVLLTVFFIVQITLISPNPGTVTDRNQDITFDKNGLNELVNYCLLDSSPELIKKLGLQGGTLQNLDLLHSRTYQGNQYRELCVQVEGAKHCINRVLTLQDMEEELASALLLNLDSCLDLNFYKNRGYTVQTGEKNLTVTIGYKEISFALVYPITLTKGDFSVTAEEFYTSLDHPLGTVYRLVLDIINDEASTGFFDKETWMTTHHLLFTIEKTRPYPYVLYTIGADDFSFLFSIQTENKASRVGRNFIYDLEYGCCYVGNACFKNVDQATCSQREGVYENTPYCSCNDHFVQTLTPKDSFEDCTNALHGESWCEHQQGVGGRSILYSCHNGEVYTETCKDFKEEVCVQTTQDGLKKAQCKPNRWIDCTSCTTQDCCENDLLRDCQWKEKDYTVLEESTRFECIPKLSPGFRFWEGSGQEVCNLGTGYALCEGYSCSQAWVNYASSYCSALGDCGIKQNYKGKTTTSGFFESDPKYKPTHGTLDLPFISFNRDQEQLLFTQEKETITMLPTLLAAWLKYIDDLSERKKTTLDYSFCTLWQPPSPSGCDLCNADPFCSEYRCKSLGEDCEYSETNGFPLCAKRNHIATDPHITFLSDMPHQGSQLELAGHTLHGFEITTLLPPYELLTFEIETDVPTKCKITYLPELSFTETPAIWFGDPSFNTRHTVQLRLPKEIAIPEKLYDNLDVATLEELFLLFVNNEDTLRDYFGEGFGEMLDKVSLHLSTRQYLTQLLALSISGLEDNTYHTFIRCADESGNENEEPIFLTFTIDDDFIDTSAPLLLETSPSNGVELHEEEYDLQLFLDEPAECKYSEFDEPFGSMPYSFECESSRLQRSTIAGGSYLCSTTTTLLNPFIRCKDNPPEIKKFMFSIKEGFNTSPVSYERHLRDINLSQQYLYNTTTIYLDDSLSLYNISFFFDEEYTCYIGANGFDVRVMQPLECTSLINTSGMICSDDFLSGDYDISLLCVGETPEQRNEHLQSYSLEYTLNTDLTIVSLFPSDSDTVSLPLELTAVVNRDSTEKQVQCGYKLDNEFYQMYPKGDFGFAKRFYTLDSGFYDITVQCLDSSGQKVEKSTSFFIE